MEYLGLDKYLQGNESITKEELLKFVEKKDITPNITVRSIPKDQMNSLYERYSLGGDQEHIVFQFGKKNVVVDAVTSRPYEAEVTPLFKSEHSEHSVKSVQFTRFTISNTFISVSLFISPKIKQFSVYGNAPISDILPSES